MYTTNIDSVVFESGNENEVILGDGFIGSNWGVDWVPDGLKNFKGIVMPEKIKSVGNDVLKNSAKYNTNSVKIIFCGDAPANWNKSKVFENVANKLEILYYDNKSGWNDIKASDFSATAADKFTVTVLDSAKANYAIDRNDGTASLTYYCGSDYKAGENYLLIVASYKNSQLVGVKYAEGTFVKDTNSISAPVSVTLDKEDGVTYRAFLMDGFNTLTPLTEAK